MKLVKYTFVLLTAGLGLLATGCANSDDVSAPNIAYHTATPTITLDELYAKANTTVQKYEGNDILEVYVSSTDEGGTFYKSVSLQDLKGTKGLSVSVDMYNINTYISPGRKVYIYLKDMYFTIAHNSLVLGELYEGAVGRMRPQDFDKRVFASAVKVNESEMVKTVTLAQLKNNNYINTLVEVNDVQFDGGAVGKPFYDANNVIGGATNINLVDSSGTMIFRTSEFAKFANEVVPKKKGKIRGVLTKYNSDFQFMARTFSDIMLTEDIKTAVGGESMLFAATINETFESFATADNVSTFPAYGNDYALGGRYWAVKSFQNNKYIQLTAFNNTAATTKSYFIVPVNFNGNNTLSFETKDGYYNGEALNVYYTPATNYNYGSEIKPETFTNITNKFTYSTGNTSGYASAFVPSGNYQFPNTVNGNGYLIFEYSGNKTVTTTIQIDNIKFQ